MIPRKKWLHVMRLEYPSLGRVRLIPASMRKRWSTVRDVVEPNHAVDGSLRLKDVLGPLLIRKRWKSFRARTNLLMIRQGYRRIGHVVQSPSPEKGNIADD